MKQFYYPKRGYRTIAQLETLAKALKASDKTIYKVTFSAVQGDCLIIWRY